MTDISITAGNVVPGSGSVIRRGTLGATLTQGTVLALNSSNQLVACDVDHATAALRTPVGILLTGGASGQPCLYLTKGPITIGGTVEVGKVYVASDTAGGIMPTNDLETGDYTSVIGIGRTSAIIDVQIQQGTVAAVVA